MSTRPQDPKRLSSLDGLRAVAISFVLLGHASHTASFPNEWKELLAKLPAMGHFGVELFFVISGFVITYSLSNEERANGTVSLRAFYLRRVLRILPPLAGYLLFVFLLEATGAIDLDRAEWATALTFTRNFCGGHWITGHLWSLAVEEQFYLFWPFVFAFAPLARWRLAYLLIAVTPICRYLLIATGHAGFANVSFFTNMDFLICGSLLGGTATEAGVSFTVLGRYVTVTRAVLTTLVLAFAAVESAQHAGLLARALSPTVRAILLALLVTSLVFAKSGISYALLNQRIVVGFGFISYSVYLWQEVFLPPPDYYRYNPPWAVVFPWNVLWSIATGWLAYLLIEKPSLRLKHMLSRIGSSKLSASVSE